MACTGWCCGVVAVNVICRPFRIIWHLFWFAWYGVLQPILKLLLVCLFWPRGSVAWDFWRKVFCSMWLDEASTGIKDKVELTADDLKTLEGDALSKAAEKFRQRISDELSMFSFVATLLATMTFTPLVTPYNPSTITGSALDGFVVCTYLAMTLSVLLAGLFVRMATTLRYCPTGNYIIWYIYRFEPTFVLMHLLFMCNIHLTILAASFALWANWRVQHDKQTNRFTEILTGSLHGKPTAPSILCLYITAGSCVLYFLYLWANSLFCRHNGLCGILDRAAADENNTKLQKLMTHCKYILAQPPFQIYDAVKDPNPAEFKVKSLDFRNECPFPQHCSINCFLDNDVSVESNFGCLKSRMIYEARTVAGAGAAAGGAAIPASAAPCCWPAAAPPPAPAPQAPAPAASPQAAPAPAEPPASAPAEAAAAPAGTAVAGLATPAAPEQQQQQFPQPLQQHQQH